jgi:hypothetical protein
MAMTQQEQRGLGGLLLRAWMWLVPIAMFVAAAIFGVVAVIDGRWGLFAFMVFVGVIAVGMLVLHWWILNRFGQPSGGQ